MKAHCRISTFMIGRNVEIAVETDFFTKGDGHDPVCGTWRIRINENVAIEGFWEVVDDKIVAISPTELKKDGYDFDGYMCAVVNSDMQPRHCAMTCRILSDYFRSVSDMYEPLSDPDNWSIRDKGGV